MDDDDIRQALHATYISAGSAPTFPRDKFKEHAALPRHRHLMTALVAVVAIVVVAVPAGLSVLLRGGVSDGSSSSLSVLDMHMYNADDGWAWSGGEDILHTTSGVGHWTIVPPPVGGQLITALGWVDDNSARIITAPGDSLNELERTYTLTPWATDNGGTTWTKGQPFRALLEAGADPMTLPVSNDLDFVDPLHGWFFDAQNGAGAPKFIYRTSDGGMDWSQVEVTPAAGTAPPGALPVDCAGLGMTFVNTTTGWVAGDCAANATFFYVTHDGGATWSPQAIACVKCILYPPEFSSPLDGALQANSGTIFVTSNGGTTWNARPLAPGNWPDFVNADDAFTMGYTGNSNPVVVMWTTTDGGMTWGEARDGAIQGDGPLHSSQLDFITPQIGWVVSLDIRFGGSIPANGQTPYPVPPPALWQTTDAGSTWTLITPTFTTSN